jgi:hypothetical protein
MVGYRLARRKLLCNAGGLDGSRALEVTTELKASIWGAWGAEGSFWGHRTSLGHYQGVVRQACHYKTRTLQEPPRAAAAEIGGASEIRHGTT